MTNNIAKARIATSDRCLESLPRVTASNHRLDSLGSVTIDIIAKAQTGLKSKSRLILC